MWAPPTGLRLLRKPGEDCDLFKTPVFYRTGHWFISTSNLTSEYFANWGWGEVVPDGREHERALYSNTN